jgi:hypothetical protein
MPHQFTIRFDSGADTYLLEALAGRDINLRAIGLIACAIRPSAAFA